MSVTKVNIPDVKKMLGEDRHVKYHQIENTLGLNLSAFIRF